MDQYLDIKVNVFDQTGQHAQVRRSLPIIELIKEIQREFDISGPPDSYSLYSQGQEDPLEPTASIQELDIQPWDVLVFDHKHRTLRWKLAPGECYRLR